jgi:hypothetical protein
MLPNNHPACTAAAWPLLAGAAFTAASCLLLVLTVPLSTAVLAGAALLLLG